MKTISTPQELVDYIIKNTDTTKLQDFYEFNKNNQYYNSIELVTKQFDQFDVFEQFFITSMYYDYNSRISLNITNGGRSAKYRAYILFLPGTTLRYKGESEEIHGLIPDEDLKKLTTSAILTKERTKRREAAFNATKPKLNLDEFSYKVFETFLAKKKAITGRDAIRYMSEVIPNWQTKDHLDLRAKYTKLIWNKSKTKSQELIRTIKNANYNGVTDDSNLPFKYVENESTLTDLEVNEKLADNVCISIYVYRYIGEKYKLPISSELLTPYASDYEFITGVTKTTKLTNRDVNLLKDKVLVLNFLLTTSNITNKTYLKQAKQQLLEVLSSDLVSQSQRDSINRTATPALQAYIKTTESLLSAAKITKEQLNESTNNNNTKD